MSDKLTLPKFHLDPGMDHLPGHHAHRQYGTNLGFSPAKVVTATMYLIIKRRERILHLFEVIKIRFDWPSGYHPFLEIEGVCLENFKLKGPIKVSHSMSPNENASWGSAVRSAVAKFPSHDGQALVYNRLLELGREVTALEKASKLFDNP